MSSGTPKILLFSIFLGGLSFAAPVTAETADDVSADIWLTAKMRSHRPGTEISEIRNRKLNSFFYNFDVDGDGISKSDFVLIHDIEDARRRASHVAPLLQRDLNGDGRITKAELKKYFSKNANQPMRSGRLRIRPSREQVREILAKRVHEALELDQNNDDVLDMSELMADAKKTLKKKTPRSRRYNPLPWSFDTDKDGIIELPEFEIVLDHVLSKLDLDQDGVASKFELEEFSTLVNGARKKELQYKKNKRERAAIQSRRDLCNLPKPSPRDNIVVVGGYQGGALSNIALGGDDAVVTAAHISISNGKTPLYLIATSSRAMVWHISGSTERVAQFVAISQATVPGGLPRVGVSGITQNKVFLPESGTCLPHFTDKNTSMAKRAAQAIEVFLGRKPDGIVGTYQIGKVTLPKAVNHSEALFPKQREIPDSTPGQPLWEKLSQLRPGGVTDLSVTKIVSRVPKSYYDVLPQEAGLAQLLDQGALEPSGKKPVYLPDRSPLYGAAKKAVLAILRKKALPAAFTILKKTKLPAGLTGAHATTFVLKQGVPRPSGDLGHSTLIVEKSDRHYAE